MSDSNKGGLVAPDEGLDIGSKVKRNKFCLLNWKCRIPSNLTKNPVKSGGLTSLTSLLQLPNSATQGKGNPGTRGRRSI